MSDRIPEPQLAAWRALLEAHAAVMSHAEQALSEAGLPPLTWYDVLWVVRESPQRRARLGELAARLTISRGGMTKLVDRLEDAGLLRREPAADDRRGSYAVLTAAGEMTLKRMWPTYAGVLAQVVGPLSASEANTLRRLLREVEARGTAPPAQAAPPPQRVRDRLARPRTPVEKRHAAIASSRRRK
jgi:DNA-binding MarR family transcriptional regulator